MKLGYWKLTRNLVENGFPMKEMNAEERITFQNEGNERNVHKETKLVETSETIS